MPSASTLGGWRLGCLGVLILASLPLIAQNATDGGYRLANLVMILVLYFVWNYLLSIAHGAQRLGPFHFLTAVLLAQVRYESILYVLIVPVVVLCKWCQRKTNHLNLDGGTFSRTSSCAAVVESEFSRRMNSSFRQSPASRFLSIGYLLNNASVAMYYLFNPNPGAIFGARSCFRCSVFSARLFSVLSVKKMKQWYLQRTGDIMLFFLFCCDLYKYVFGAVPFLGALGRSDCFPVFASAATALNGCLDASDLG